MPNGFGQDVLLSWRRRREELFPQNISKCCVVKSWPHSISGENIGREIVLVVRVVRWEESDIFIGFIIDEEAVVEDVVEELDGGVVIRCCSVEKKGECHVARVVDDMLIIRIIDVKKLAPFSFRKPSEILCNFYADDCHLHFEAEAFAESWEGGRGGGLGSSHLVGLILCEYRRAKTIRESQGKSLRRDSS